MEEKQIDKTWWPHCGKDFIISKYFLHICILESNIFPIHIRWGKL